MKRILYTGNRGFFGARFQSYHANRHVIRGVDKDDVDILDRRAVERTLREFAPDLVIHGAAITSTGFGNANPELTRRINVDGARNVAEACKALGADLLFLSTEQVFNGNAEPGPYTEDDHPVPDTEYGKTKLEAERRLRESMERLWIVRFTWLFGLPERLMPANPNVLWNTFQIALSGEPARLPVNELRGLTYVYDMVERLLHVTELPCGTYHIGSSNSLSRYEFSCHIFRELGLEHRIDALLIPDREKYAETPRDIRLDTGRLAGAGVTFPGSSEALVSCLREFGLHRVFGPSG